MSRATCRRRIGNGIASPRDVREARVRPSARRRTRAPPGCSSRGRASPANRCATSHIVANASRALGPALAIASSIILARTSGGRPDPDVGPVEREHLRRVGRVDEVEGGSVRDVVAVQLRRLVPVRRAPGGVEERDVVGVRELLRRRSGELAETDREHGGAQRVLERLPGAEVGREREGADHLGGADRPLGRRAAAPRVPPPGDPARACRKPKARLSTLARRPALTVLVGALAISFSAILFRLSHVSPSTGAFYRCVWALPALWPISLWEERRWGSRPLARAPTPGWPASSSRSTSCSGTTRSTRSAPGSPPCWATRRSCWSASRLAAARASGPGALALVAIPVVLVGVVLISGVLEQGAYGDDPGARRVFGSLTALAYSGFLLALRQGSARPRRPGRAAVRRHLAARARLPARRRRRRRSRPGRRPGRRRAG